MSHITTKPSQIKDEKLLKETLKELGFTVLESTKMDTYYAGQKAKADVVFQVPNTPRTIGFIKQQDGRYALTGDFWGFRSTTQEKLLSDITLGYNQKLGNKEMADKRMTLINTQKCPDGRVISVYRGL